MTISIRKNPTDRLLELGGGEAPMVHPEVLGGRDVNVDIRTCHLPDGRQCTDISFNFDDGVLPLDSGDFDGVISKWAVEHISWRKVPSLLKECNRVTKGGGYLTLVLPNTEAQLKWVMKKGWKKRPPREGMTDFEEASCVLFGDQNYTANSHASYFSPELITDLLVNAGYEGVIVTPFGETLTDMIVEAKKPALSEEAKKAAEIEAQTLITAGAPDVIPAASKGFVIEADKEVEVFSRSDHSAHFVKEIPIQERPELPYDPAKTFDRQYFDGGKEGGGYQLYLDFPCHEITARHVLARKPESVLELGCGRGYVLKRIQDASVPAIGIDVSKHCYLTRVADGVYQGDITGSWNPWKCNGDKIYDLCLSVAVLEHIPESKLPDVIREMKRTCRRGLHGIFFCPAGTDNDKTKRTLRPKEWWLNLFHEVAPDWPCEIVAKDELEGGMPFPKDVLEGDGKVKFNFGCAQTQFHHGWINVDLPNELGQWSAANGYKYVRADCRNTLPFKTDEASLIYSAHMIEHLTYKEGLAFLKECRRIIKIDGAMRIIVPDAHLLMQCYYGNGPEEGGSLEPTIRKDGSWSDISNFDEINAGCAECPTAAGKLWSLLGYGHQAFYDYETLKKQLEAAGWAPAIAQFRKPALVNDGLRQILRETLDTLPSLSLYVDAVPAPI